MGGGATRVARGDVLANASEILQSYERKTSKVMVWLDEAGGKKKFKGAHFCPLTAISASQLAVIPLPMSGALVFV
jgi:hypothetical protein